MSLGHFVLPALLTCSFLLQAPVATAESAASASRAAEPAVGRAPIARPPADVPLSHWSYPLLERLQARGVIDIDLSARPVSRSDVAAAVSAARSSEALASGSLSERELWLLSRLEAEFVRGEVDSPAFTAGTGSASFGLSVNVFTQMRYGGDVVELDLWPGSVPGGITPLRGAGVGAGGNAGVSDVGVDAGDEAQFDVASDIGYEIWGGVEGLVGFYADSQLLLGGQDGARQVRVSNRLRTWRGVSASSERAYFKLERPSYSIVLGRRGTAWGRSRWGRLMLSGTAPTFDQLNVRYEVGSLSFEAMHAFLEYRELGTEQDLGDGENLFLATHRLVVRGKWGSVGVAEAVVYGSVLPDPVYVNPLTPYYLAQHRERSNDNVFWLLDGVYHVLPGLTAYGEFLIDDLQYERATGSPDKYGLTLGGAWYGAVRGLDAELTAEYTNVRNWTYTHKYTEYRLAHDGLPIGFELGPDADRFRAEFVFHPGVKWSVGTTYEHARKGDGRITIPFNSDEDQELTFPSGVVKTADRVGVELGYRNLERLAAGVGVAYESVANVGNTLGEDDDGWEFWAGVAFRI